MVTRVDEDDVALADVRTIHEILRRVDRPVFRDIGDIDDDARPDEFFHLERCDIASARVKMLRAVEVCPTWFDAVIIMPFAPLAPNA